MNEIVKRRIENMIDAILPYGSGAVSEVRLRAALEVVAETAWKEAESQVLMNLLTIEQMAEIIGVSPRRMRAIAAHRHQRFGVGWKVPGTRGAWLFRPQEIESLRPGPSGKPPKQKIKP